MPIFAWWSGRGYCSALIVFAVMLVAGLSLNVLQATRFESRVFWGLVIAVSAIPNWIVGQRLNRAKRSVIRSKPLRDRLIYRARNTFFSLPMETFSIVILFAGLGIAASGV